jgi:glyoxylase-like metal-dependent hydrolase (beta-lactamase superfamily II)
MAVQPYQIYAIRYARLHRLRRDNLLLCPEGEANLVMPIDYYFWVVRNAERTLVIDTGYAPDLAVQLGRRFECDPMNTLRAIGVEPGEVENVVLTHLHYDHAGNTGAFTRAHFHCHEAELSFAEGWYSREPAFSFLYRREHIESVKALLDAGRVTLLRGDFEIAPGVELFHIPGHSPGHMSVRVATERGPVVLAVDAAHFKANMVERRPYPLYTDLEQIVRGYDRLRALAPDLDHIVCGHDSDTIDLYPPAAPDLAGKVVRLDLPPR